MVPIKGRAPSSAPRSVERWDSSSPGRRLRHSERTTRSSCASSRTSSGRWVAPTLSAIWLARPRLVGPVSVSRTTMRPPVRARCPIAWWAAAIGSELPEVARPSVTTTTVESRDESPVMPVTTLVAWSSPAARRVVPPVRRSARRSTHPLSCRSMPPHPPPLDGRVPCGIGRAIRRRLR